MFVSIPTAVVEGVDGRAIFVELKTGRGIPGIHIIGLPDAACREASDRVKAAISSSGLTWPQVNLTVNLAPSGLRKQGAGLDLAIALGVLVASEQLSPESIQGIGAIGELGLDGALRPVIGMIALAHAVPAGRIIVPDAQSSSVAAIRPGEGLSARSLREVYEALSGDGPPLAVATPGSDDRSDCTPRLELADVRGQLLARQALEIAAAGGHHLLMVGPAGGGKSMLAARLPALLPDLDREQAVSVTKVHSVAGTWVPSGGLLWRPPFRAPHHGASAVALIGGGSVTIRPGEVSLASNGVLFLDELGEFPVSVLEALRQPLEEGVVRVARAHASATMPARFQLIGAMNPCPCGEARPGVPCRCSDVARDRYARRLSGPLLDRFDLRIEVEPPDPALLLGSSPHESTEVVAARVAQAREVAESRGVRCNADLSSQSLDSVAPLTRDARGLLEAAVLAGSLSGRGVRRVRTVARTVADLSGQPSGPIDEASIATAMALRSVPFSVVGAR